MEDEKEALHLIRVLKETQTALANQDSLKLKELSNQTIHSASIYQDTDSISIAIIIYSLSKIIERQYYLKIKDFRSFAKKINSSISSAIKALKENNGLDIHLENIREIMSSSINVKPLIQDVLRKASINKASKIYEHGISLEQTSKLLGITQWELAEYIGQGSAGEVKETLDIKNRARMALEFFS